MCGRTLERQVKRIGRKGHCAANLVTSWSRAKQKVPDEFYAKFEGDSYDGIYKESNVIAIGIHQVGGLLLT